MSYSYEFGKFECGIKAAESLDRKHYLLPNSEQARNVLDLNLKVHNTSSSTTWIDFKNKICASTYAFAEFILVTKAEGIKLFGQFTKE